MDSIYVDLFHIKFANGGCTSIKIANFYEVCGQAQKSANWKYKEPEEMLNHISVFFYVYMLLMMITAPPFYVYKFMIIKKEVLI